MRKMNTRPVPQLLNFKPHRNLLNWPNVYSWITDYSFSSKTEIWRHLKESFQPLKLLPKNDKRNWCRITFISLWSNHCSMILAIIILIETFTEQILFHACKILSNRNFCMDFNMFRALEGCSRNKFRHYLSGTNFIAISGIHYHKKLKMLLVIFDIITADIVTNIIMFNKLWRNLRTRRVKEECFFF